MLFFPNAKINIGLAIVNKRPDGFHDIETIFYPLPVCDAVEFIVAGSDADSDRLTLSGINVGLDPEENIVLKSLEKMREHRYIPWLNIHIHKNIPVGGGLGGGSSDAAFMLRYLNRYFSFGFDTTFLKSIASSLGSDCAFFIDNVPSLGQGRGDILTPVGIKLQGYWLVVANPGTSVNTGSAYMNCTPRGSSADLIAGAARDPELWQEYLSNDFEQVVFPGHPEIESLRDQLLEMGAFYSAMSGSGSSVFGIFKTQPPVNMNITGKVIFSGRL